MTRHISPLTVALLVACAPAIPPEPPPAPPAPEPSPPGACEAAEANLERLQCTEVASDGERIELWVGFSGACNSSELDGSDWNAEHVACAKSCDQALAAWVGKWTCPESSTNTQHKEVIDDNPQP
jgi:hypothetical protein